MSNGELVNASADENSDLFHSIPWSHGTLGFLTAVKIPLVPAKTYVKLEYYPSDTVHEAKRLLQATGHDFIEGIMFGPKKFVVMHGNMVDEAEAEPGRVNYINRWNKPWFFKYVEGLSGPVVDYIPIRDYLHRHTRSYFWEVPTALPYGNNFIFRAILGWVYPMDYQLLKMVGSSTSPVLYEMYFGTNHVIQDFMLPMNELESALTFVHDLLEIYPIWLCPCKFFNKPGMVHSDPAAGESELYIDIGIYGTTKKWQEFEQEKTTRALEGFVLEKNG